MSIFYEGAPCVICGLPIRRESGDTLVAFPVFVGNTADPFYRYNDANVHRQCFQEDPRWREVEKRVDLVLAVRGNKVCRYCGELVQSPNDAFFLGYLSAADCHDLRNFNFLRAHRECFKSSGNLPILRKAVLDAQKRGEWSADGAQILLQVVERELT